MSGLKSGFNSGFNIEIPSSPNSSDVTALLNEFYNPHVTPAPLLNPPSVAYLFLRDSQHRMQGGAFVEFLYDVCSLNNIWVAEECRNAGHGARLYRAIEDLAYLKKRKRVILSTFQFQGSLKFWEKMGFTIFAELPGDSEGSRLYYMQKSVTDRPFDAKPAT